MPHQVCASSRLWRAQASNRSTGGCRCQETRLQGRGSPPATSRFPPPTESQGRMSVSPAELLATLLLLLPPLEAAPFVHGPETLCRPTSAQYRERRDSSVECRLPARDPE